MKIFLVAGARPNFMKIAPIIRAIKTRGNPDLEWKIVHTGQHYDYEMSQAFFDDLEIPKPNYFLEAGSGSHAEQTARIMISFEKVCEQERPDIVIVVGDVNSTLACSIVAKKLLIKVAHIEAGLRSFDQSMPEEINRMVTDSISDFLFVTEMSAVRNLLNEGKAKNQIFFVGNVMVDNLFHQAEQLKEQDESRYPSYQIKRDLGKYAFLTLHRPSNVDIKEVFTRIADALNHISAQIPIIFPVHPRTEKMIKEFQINLSGRIFPLPPLGYRESLFLWKDATLVMTDSGGLQEETTALGVSCMTLRENTERPVTVEKGTNTLAGNNREGIIYCYEQIMRNEKPDACIPPKWDGKAAERIVEIIERISL